ncbi:MAG: autotransporter outer membrane beta-barrel domain-containing protein [Methylotenera sp.]|nr:autotransporter outer membrane beta-barrel domain-containing protein [Methylotenera sp.]
MTLVKHNFRAIPLAIMSLAFGFSTPANAVSYTVNQSGGAITISSQDAGFSQQTANTFYFPTSTSAVTTFSFADRRGFTISNTEAGFNNNRENIVGIPSSGGGINMIAGIGYNSTITVKDALSGATLFTGLYRSVLTGNSTSWFEPSMNMSYANGTLTVNAIGDVQQINADGSVTYSVQGASFLIGNYLLFSAGPSAVDTQASLRTSAQKTRSIFNASSISSNFANMNTYDCNLFDTKGMCISAGGRFTTVDNPNSNSTSAVVVVGYKATPNIRIGGFLDQNVNNNTPSGINISNKNPLMGAFAVWNQNTDGLGYQVKLANAYQDKNVDTTREVIGTSEAGKGSTDLTTQSYVAELSYAFNYNDKTLLRPYLALRHTSIKQDAYTETGVATPLSYDSLEDRSTTALLGLKLNHQLTPKTTLTASLGIEQDLERSVDDYSATSTGISGLTAENFNDSIKRTRPVVSAGAYYAVSKTQRIAGDIYYQQLPFQSTGSTTAYFNYTVGF